MSETAILYTNYKEPLKTFTFTTDEGHETEGFGYFGTLATNSDKTKIQCHLCGDFFMTLNSHIRVKHSLNGPQYKKLVGLSATTALVGEESRDAYIRRYSKANLEKSKAALIQYWKDVKEGKREAPKRSKWRLERYNKAGNCPDQILDQIKKLGEKLDRTPTIKEFETTTHISKGTVEFAYGSWAEAVKIAGLRPRDHYRVSGPQTSKEELLASMRTFYKRYGRVPRSSDFRRGILPNARIVKRYFPGPNSMNQAREAAGLPILVNTGGGTRRNYLELIK